SCALMHSYYSVFFRCLDIATHSKFFFFYCYGHHRYLHSFPTRRSSDLNREWIQGARCPKQTTPMLRSTVAPGKQIGREFHPSRADRKSTRLNSSHLVISYAVFCLKKKKPFDTVTTRPCRHRA